MWSSFNRSSETFKLFKKEADGYILGLPDTVPESKHGVKLYNLLDKGTEKEQTPVGELLEPYGPRDFLGDWGLTKLWGILDSNSYMPVCHMLLPLVALQ